MRSNGGCWELNFYFLFAEIVEADEECDCGSSYNCAIKDPCCYPRDSTQQCKVNRKTYDCHPAEDLCCTNTCQYKNLAHFGIVSCRKLYDTSIR